MGAEELRTKKRLFREVLYMTALPITDVRSPGLVMCDSEVVCRRAKRYGVELVLK